MILKYQLSKSKKIGKAKKIWLLGIRINTIRSSKGSEYIWIKKSKNKNLYKRIFVTSSSVATGILIFIKRRERRIEQISQLFKLLLAELLKEKWSDIHKNFAFHMYMYVRKYRVEQLLPLYQISYTALMIYRYRIRFIIKTIMNKNTV